MNRFWDMLLDSSAQGRPTDKDTSHLAHKKKPVRSYENVSRALDVSLFFPVR